MGYLEYALVFANHLMEHIPSYDQRKRNKFYKMKTQFMAERAKEYHERDDDLIMNLREQLIVFLEAFYKEIKNDETTKS